MPQTYYNTILFRATGTGTTGPTCALTLDRPWKLSAGLKPDINQAVCPAPEFANITDVNQVGQIELYFSSQSTSPDVTIVGVKLVDIEPLGGVAQYIPSGNTTVTTGFAEYRLSFADFRESFQAPRGGRLYYGPINAGPAGQPTDTTSSSSATTASTAPELTMVQLVTLCLQGMGLNAPAGGWPSGNWGNLPSSLNQTAAPRNLKWFGNHAAQELDKLLTAAGHVFCPHLDGTWSVEQITATAVVTWGSPPGGGSYTTLTTGTAAKIDQRGHYVAITSAPIRAVNTETLTGPGSGSFDFVVWVNSAGKWESLADFFGSTTLAAQAFNGWVNGGVNGLGQVQGLSAAQQDPAIASQIFSFVRISDKVLGNRLLSPILACRFEADGSQQPIQIIATGAAMSSNGSAWANSPNPLSFAATNRLHDHVLALSAPAFSVDSSGNFQELAAGSMTIRFSIEQYQTNPLAQSDTTGTQPPYVPLYYTSGFSASASGGPTQMDSDDVADLLNGTTKGAIVIDRPEMLLLVVDGSEINRGQLDAVAGQIAAAYLRSSSTADEQARVGFAPIQPSGWVSSVEWDQKAVKTTAHCEDYYTAAASVGMHSIRKTEGGNGSGQSSSEAHPHEAKTQSSRESLGAAGNSPRNLPLMPSPSLPGGGSTVSLVWATSTISGGEYMGMVWTTPSVPVSSDGLSLNFSGNPSVSGIVMQGTPCVLINLLENNYSTNNLPLQKVVFGLRGQPQPQSAGSQYAGLPTYFVQWDPDAIRDIAWDSTNHLLWDATWASPTTPQRKTIVQFVDCQTGT